ncbi:hypothetical protein [Methylobacterium marchantiae]|uniref:Protein argonaute n=1 Tax=Methylobacterium marchantiae TaxID=600331 RepID=A0ABW3X206_9HYPH
MVVVPLVSGAVLPGERQGLPAHENLSLVSALARETVFRLLAGMGEQGYRVTRRRPPTVEAAKHANVIPPGLGLPDWLKKRVVLEFQTRVLHPRNAAPYVVLTCSKRLRTTIAATCADLQDLGVPLLGSAVTTYADDPDPKVSGRLRYAGRIVAVDPGVLTLDEHGEGAQAVAAGDLFLEPTRSNFNKVVEALTQGRSERILRDIQAAEAEWHAGGKTLDTVQSSLTWLSRKSLELADGVPLEFDGLMDQSMSRRFPRTESIWKPKLSFDPSIAPETSLTWAQKGLDQVGPYDRQSFVKKRLSIAVICEAENRHRTEVAVDHLLRGLPDVRSGGTNPLAPHGTGLLGRFRLAEPAVSFFEVPDDSAKAYVAGVRQAVSAASARDERWDLAIVQVRRSWQERPYDDSPYWSSKAAFLKQETPVQALFLDLAALEDLGYAMAMANMSLAIYAKLGGAPWLLPVRSATDHELVFGLGSHTTKEGRRGAGERMVGIATMFSGQGHYYLDSRTAAVPFAEYPAALRATIVDAVGRIRHEEGWREDDAVRLVFHAFIQLRREAVEAVAAAVADLGLKRATFAFLHVVEDSAFVTFDRAVTSGRGAYGPERGQAVELGDREWLLTLTGRDQLRNEMHGLPDPVLLRLHDLSTYRDMPTLARQVSDFANHSWRTFGPARLPITLGYANEIARQLAGLERTPNWDVDAMEGSRVMRRPWFL